MRCKAHPKYAAQRMPPKTIVNPDGCPTCWGIWEYAKTDPKRLAPMVAIELTHDEARRAALAFSRVERAPEMSDPALQRLYQLLADATRMY